MTSSLKCEEPDQACAADTSQARHEISNLAEHIYTNTQTQIYTETHMETHISTCPVYTTDPADEADSLESHILRTTTHKKYIT